METMVKSQLVELEKVCNNQVAPEIKSAFEELDKNDIHEVIKDFGICISDTNSDSKNVLFLKKPLSGNLCYKFETSNDEFIIYFASQMIDFRKNDIHQAYYVISVAKLLKVSDKALSDLYVKYNWGGFEKGQKYFDTITQCRKSLTQLLFDGKVALMSAYSFHNFFENDNYDEILTLLSDLTFSEMNKNLQYLIEIAKNSGNNHETLTDVANSVKNHNAKEISQIIYQTRYPQRSGFEQTFDDFLSNVKLKNRVTAPFLLEKQTYNLNVTFKDAEDLVKQLDNIRNKLNGLDKNEDLFILDNIFAKSQGK